MQVLEWFRILIGAALYQNKSQNLIIFAEGCIFCIPLSSLYIMNKFKSSLFLILFVLSSLPICAQKIYVDSLQAGSQYHAYPLPDYGIPQLSPSPEGYKPFHMEHYGRHGSRWLIGNKAYSEPLEYLKKAKDYGKLTPRGEQLLEQITIIAEDSKGRVGELSPLGHRQHRGIAQRMAANFPEIFSDSTIMDTKSTMVIRCILSMANEVAEFQKMFPGMQITMDASATTQPILAYNSHDTVAKNLSSAVRDTVRNYRNSLPKPESFYAKIFNDRQFVTDSLGDKDVFDAIWDVAVNMQSHDNYPYIYDIFTEDEINNQWLYKNANWYITAGNTPLTNNRVPYNQRVLLRNIVESADTAMMSTKTSANLRFGHESILLPLSVLMELGNAGYETTDITTLADHWRNYEIFPMGSNIQMIFYRPENREYSLEDILVKVLLNEKEVTLPVEAVSGPYYRWVDLRKLYMDKLDGFSSRFPE